MASITRRTYDTDSVVLRRIYVNEPTTNRPISTNQVLVTSTSGKAVFLDANDFFTQNNIPTNTALPSTVAGLGQIYLSSGSGTGDVTTSNLVSTVAGLGQIYLSSGSGTGDVTTSNLVSTVAGLGQIYLSSGGGSGDVTTANLTSTTLGLGTLGYISSATGNVNVNNLVSTPLLASSLQSTVAGLGSAGYISTAANFNDTNLQSTVKGLGTTGYISTAANFDDTNLQSTVRGLGTTGYISTAANFTDDNLRSTVRGLGSAQYVSSSTLFSTVAGLGRIFVSTGAFSSNLSSFSTGLSRTFVTSTVTASSVTATTLTTSVLNVSTISFGTGSGFVTFNNLRASYLSSASTYAYSLVGDFISGAQLKISSLEGDGSLLKNLSTGIQSALASTIEGLGTIGYISSPTGSVNVNNLVSTPFLDTALASTFAGLGQTYISAAGASITVPNLTSTVAGLGEIYVSTAAAGITVPNLTSSLTGLGTLGYISSPTGTVNVNNLVSTPLLASSLQSTVAGLGSAGYISSVTGTINVNNLVSTPLLASSLQSTVAGLGSAGYISIAQLLSTTQGLIDTLEVTSTTQGLGTLGYISSAQLVSTTQGLLGGEVNSTIQGLGTIGYISSYQLLSTTEGLGTLGYISTATGGASGNFLSTIPSTFTLDQLQIYQSITVGYADPFLHISTTLGGGVKIEANRLDLGKTNLFTSTGMVFADAFGTNPSTVAMANLNGKLSLVFENSSTSPPESDIIFYNSKTFVQGTPYDTAFNPIPFSYISSIAISTTSLSFTSNTNPFTASTNTITRTTNLFNDNRAVGSYSPVKVIVSTLAACNDMYILAEDVGKFFLITTDPGSGAGINLPGADGSLDGWNIFIKNMQDSAFNLTVQTTSPVTLSPGVATTVVCNGINFYSL